jgi:hypothetical protein
LLGLKGVGVEDTMVSVKTRIAQKQRGEVSRRAKAWFRDKQQHPNLG